MSAKLFNEPSNGTIVVHDVDGNTQEVTIKRLRFRLAVYGILQKKDSILFQWNPIVKKYNLPGGAVELGEKMQDALIREYQEETGIAVQVKRLLGVKEDFFVFRDEYAHSILVFYEVEKIQGEMKGYQTTDDSAGAKFLHFRDLNVKSFTPPFREILLSVMGKTSDEQ